jgi:hypothetical protein
VAKIWKCLFESGNVSSFCCTVIKNFSENLNTHDSAKIFRCGFRPEASVILYEKFIYLSCVWWKKWKSRLVKVKSTQLKIFMRNHCFHSWQPCAHIQNRQKCKYFCHFIGFVCDFIDFACEFTVKTTDHTVAS